MSTSLRAAPSPFTLPQRASLRRALNAKRRAAGEQPFPDRVLETFVLELEHATSCDFELAEYWVGLVGTKTPRAVRRQIDDAFARSAS